MLRFVYNAPTQPFSLTNPSLESISGFILRVMFYISWGGFASVSFVEGVSRPDPRMMSNARWHCRTLYVSRIKGTVPYTFCVR